MKILKFKFYDHHQQWGFDEIDFSGQNLTLLVGVSGVGKTKILESIAMLKQIANGKSFNGVEWDVTFLKIKGIQYRWYGKFDFKEEKNLFSISTESQYSIEYEFVYKEQDKVAERWREKVILLADFPDLPGDFLILKDKTILKALYFHHGHELGIVKNEISKIEFESKYYDNQEYFSQEKTGDFLSMIEGLNKEDSFDGARAISNLQIPVKLKMLLAHIAAPDVFEEIKEMYLEIFDNVKNIRVKLDTRELDEAMISTRPRIEIKEKGIDEWIPESKISAGMIKALLLVAHLYLMDKGSVILLDEFENSLGVNCIDAVTRYFQLYGVDQQIILTSHHPYIINNINMKGWKIVTRDGGKVTVKNAEELGLGKSKHSAFMQLINSDEYLDGIAVS